MAKVNYTIQLALNDPFIENNILKFKKKLGVITVMDK